MSAKATPVRFGALSLLLLIVSIVLALLAVLALTTAHAASSMTERHVAYVDEVYVLEAQGQQWLARTDGALVDAQAEGSLSSLGAYLTDGAAVSGDTVSVTLGSAEALKLDIVLKVGADYRYTIESWKITREFPEDAAIGNLWQP